MSTNVFMMPSILLSALTRRARSCAELHKEVNLLLWQEPLLDKCSVSMREQHLGVDIAKYLRRLREERAGLRQSQGV